MKTQQRQPELDGLRALAVSLVLFNHLGASYVPGGYIGVDVFFVLSGFLITRLIVGEISKTGTLSFRNFYFRRIRRLFPALISTVLFSWIAAFALFSPVQLKNFAGSAAASILSVSNFLFWSQANYFDALASTKPLLHTWSLSVEEQFYVVWPVSMYALWKWRGPRAVPLGLIVLTIFSLALSNYWLSTDMEAAFYLLPGRVFELGIGALVVWFPRLKQRYSSEILAILGILLICYSAVFFTNKTPFPGVSALIPCVGTALFIYGSSAPFATWVFRLQPVVWLGRISYSLYLVHWPVIVFFTVMTFRSPSGFADIALLSTASLVLAWVQFTLVEQKFRYVQADVKRTFVVAAVVAVAISLPSYQVAGRKGLAWRIPESRALPTNAFMRRKQNKLYCRNTNPDLDKKLFTCQNFRGKDKNIFLWGDSHALHLVAGFSESFPEHNVYVAFLASCQAQSGFAGYLRDFRGAGTDACLNRNKAALKFFLETSQTNVIISGLRGSTPETLAGASNLILDQLNDYGHQAFLMGDFVGPGIVFSDCIVVPDYFISDETIKEKCRGNQKRAAGELRYNHQLEKLVSDAVFPDAVQCPNDICTFKVNGTFLHRDRTHLSVDGSIIMIEWVKDRFPF